MLLGYFTIVLLLLYDLSIDFYSCNTEHLIRRYVIGNVLCRPVTLTEIPL